MTQGESSSESDSTITASPSAPRRWLPPEIARAIQMGGGLKRTLSLLARLWITEGWRGYVWRIRLVRDSTLTKRHDVSGSDYQRWCQLHDLVDGAHRSSLHSDLQTWPHRPLISVLMPVFNPKIDWLEQAIQSVREQVYQDWELCIADDASTQPDVRVLLQTLAEQEPRIKLTLREKNGHICAASNSAFELARGEFVALLDHDDLLPPHALYWVAKAALMHPGAGIIYSDEDKIDEEGKRSGPYFKPAFNYDLFLSQNMVSHLGVYRRPLVDEVGRFREGLEGSQDYDLALRCMEQLRPEQIVHIPKILYHWRLHNNSTASNMAAKPYAALAGEKALNAHLARTNQQGSVQYIGHGYQYLPPPQEGLQRVSVIMYLRAGASDVSSMADRLRKQTSLPILEFLWVLCPSMSVAEESRIAAQLTASRDECFGNSHGPTIAARVNAAAQHSAGEQLVLLLGGARPRDPGWLTLLTAHARRPRVGIVGARLWEQRGGILQAGLFANSSGRLLSAHHGQSPLHKGYFGRSALNQSFLAVSSACITVRRSLFEAVEGLNVEWKTIRYAVADLCIRLNELGHRTLWTPDADVELSHEEHDEVWHASESTPDEIQDAHRWAAQWMCDQAEDPHYNPNLSWERSHFEFAFPPRLNHQGGHTSADAAPEFRLPPYAVAPWEKSLS